MTAIHADYESRIVAHRATLAKHLSERKDPLDLPYALTQRERDAYVTATATLIQQSAEFESIVDSWRALPNLDLDTTWLSHLHEWRDTLDSELSALPPKIRNPEELEQRRVINWSIGLIERGIGNAPYTMPIVDLSSTRIGQLMAAAGYQIQGEGLRGPMGFRGSLSEVEARIKLQTAERQKVQMALDRLMATPEELAQLAKRAHDDSTVLNTMDLKNNADGTMVIAFTKDGEPLSVADMTPEQRSAFERFVLAAFPERETVEP